jgi:hypothetical protein
MGAISMNLKIYLDKILRNNPPNCTYENGTKVRAPTYKN